VSAVEPDLDGPGAPPRSNGELVFEHPWQSRLFATTIALCDSGTIAYEDFRRRLIATIEARPDEYWASWQDAIEGLLAELRLCDPDELAARATRFAAHEHLAAPD
jgi:hypothetical protein